MRSREYVLFFMFDKLSVCFLKTKNPFTGSLSTFVNVLSARTAVGHDAEGKLVLFHCEGQTGVRG